MPPPARWPGGSISSAAAATSSTAQRVVLVVHPARAGTARAGAPRMGGRPESQSWRPTWAERGRSSAGLRLGLAAGARRSGGLGGGHEDAVTGPRASLPTGRRPTLREAGFLIGRAAGGVGRALSGRPGVRPDGPLAATPLCKSGLQLRYAQGRSHSPTIRLLAAALSAASPCLSWAARQLILTVVDHNTGKPVPCRHAEERCRPGEKRPDKVPTWQDHFVFPGNIAKLPLGEYTFEIERGPEYRQHRPLHHRQLRRRLRSRSSCGGLSNMTEEGWWSGDLDVHRPQNDIQLLDGGRRPARRAAGHLVERRSDRTDKPPPKYPRC